MTKLYDDHKQVTIQMFEYDNRDNTRRPDWENDFFNVGSLDYDEERDAYKVYDVDYCIEQAKDWETSTGDYAMDECPEYMERIVIVSDERAL